MGDFKRSPSKVWSWNEDNTTWRLQTSASPGSQDSGFSDTEPLPAQRNILRDITKDGQDDSSKNKNSNQEYKEKSVSDKNSFNINVEKLNRAIELQKLQQTKPLYQKRSRRNLFKADCSKTARSNQYAKDDYGTNRQQISSGVTFDGSNASLQESIPSNHTSTQQRLNKSAPAALEVLKENDERVEDGSGHSDCDSEIENYFRASTHSPKHTSTPKAARQDMRQCKRKAALSLHQMRYQRERYVDFLFSVVLFQ